MKFKLGYLESDGYDTIALRYEKYDDEDIVFDTIEEAIKYKYNNEPPGLSDYYIIVDEDI